MGNKTNGLLALLGVGALAFWKYKNSSPEKQQEYKDKLNSAKDGLSKLGSDLKSKASNVASQAQEKANEFANRAENKVEEVKSDAQNM